MAWGFLSRISGGIFGNAIGYGVGTTLGNAMEPLAQAERNKLWPLDPNVPLTPEQLAQMVVQGILHEPEATSEAKLSGVDSQRFHKLFLVNGDPIAPEQALDLWNRREISEGDVNRALMQSRLKPQWVDTFKLLKRQLLQQAELAEMVVQDVLQLDEATARAEHLGIHPDDFAHLVKLAGNPPGPQDTLSLWNRHIFSEEEATLALRQSRLKPEWIEKFKKSRIRPASVADAVRGVIRKRIQHDEGARIAAENGIDGKTFDLLVNTAGRAIGIQQALTLYNRGVYTKADVEHVVAFSDVRTEFTEAIMHLAVRYPSLFQLRGLISSGAISDADAITYITDQGYPHKLAEGIVKVAHGLKTAKERDLTKTEIGTLYETHAISRDDALGMLKKLGYDPHESEYILDLGDFRRDARFLESVVNRVHSQFVNHKITASVVTTELDSVGMPTDQRERLITLWTNERAANIRVLSEAQIVKATHKKLLTLDEGKARLLALGYDDGDADILLSE